MIDYRYSDTTGYTFYIKESNIILGTRVYIPENELKQIHKALGIDREIKQDESDYKQYNRSSYGTLLK